MRTSRAVALALMIGAFFTAQEILMDLARRRPDAARQDVVDGLLFWALWVALSPAVLLALRRWPVDAKPLSRRVVGHAGVAVTLSVAHNLLAVAALSLVVPVWPAGSLSAALLANTNPTAFVWGVFTGVLFYSAILMSYAVVRFQRLYVAERVSAAALEAELTRSKLDTLRSQLRPHFLFNTLNAISVFVTEDAEKAERMLLQLSALLRRSLDEEAHEVPLEPGADVREPLPRHSARAVRRPADRAARRRRGRSGRARSRVPVAAAPRECDRAREVER